jgi:hypothetical protein
VNDKFKLHLNPHLVPYRLPDGLECFIHLELAQHCMLYFSILLYNHHLGRHDIYPLGNIDQQPVQRNQQQRQHHQLNSTQFVPNKICDIQIK